jgi:hypothetical protein
MKNTKLWTLVKKEWLDNQEISDEALGQLIRGLHLGVMPQHAIAKVMYTAVKQEYEKVNNYVKTKEDQRSEQSRKAAQARWSNTPVMQQHTNSNANKDTGIDTGIGKGTDLGIVWMNKVNE